MILYIFISCNSRFERHQERIKEMMQNLNCENYIMVLGGEDTEIYDPEQKILKLNCNDYYEGLPEKVIKTFKFINDNDAIFENYKYYCKLDDDMEVKKLLNENELFDYCGKKCRRGSRKAHFGKCSVDNYFNNNEYMGPFVPWCLGGYGYVISKNSLSILAKDTNYLTEIYEDVYVGKILKKKNIYPINIPNLYEYLYSKDHNYFLRT